MWYVRRDPIRAVFAPPRITPMRTREYGKGYAIGGSVGIPDVSGMPKVARMHGLWVGPRVGPPRIGPRLPTEEPTGEED